MSETEIKQAEVVTLRPGDVVVLNTAHSISREAAEAIEEKLEAQFPDNECVVVTGGHLGVIRPEES